MKILMVSSEWPSEKNPQSAPFVVRQFNKLRQRGIDVDLVHVRGSGNILNYINNWLKVRRVLNNNTYDLIHAQWGQSALTVFFSGLPIVVTYRGDDLEGTINAKGQHGLNSYILRFVSGIVSLFSNFNIVVSSHLISKLWSRTTPIAIIPSGIDFSIIPAITKSEARQKFGFTDGKKIVLFPYNTSIVRKQFSLVKQSIDLLPDNLRSEVELFVLYGVPQQIVLECMIASDFLIFASLHEGSPNVIKEAIACNLPIISVDVADVRDRIGLIPGCAIVNSYNPREISKALENLFFYDYCNYQSRSFVANLDEDILVEKLISVYKKVLN